MNIVDPGVTGRRAVGDRSQDRRPLLPSRVVCEHFGIVPRTLDRWLANPALDFPKPVIINKRKYWKPREIEDFELLRSAGSNPEAA